MGLTNENVGPKILAKIKIYVLTRAELLFTLCYEIPCSLDVLLMQTLHYTIGNHMALFLHVLMQHVQPNGFFLKNNYHIFHICVASSFHVPLVYVSSSFVVSQSLYHKTSTEMAFSLHEQLKHGFYSPSEM